MQSIGMVIDILYLSPRLGVRLLLTARDSRFSESRDILGYSRIHRTISTPKRHVLLLDTASLTFRRKSTALQ